MIFRGKLHEKSHSATGIHVSRELEMQANVHCFIKKVLLTASRSQATRKPRDRRLAPIHQHSLTPLLPHSLTPSLLNSTPPLTNRSSSALSAKTPKQPHPTPPQPLQRIPHLPQLPLQPNPTLVIRPLIQRHIDAILDLPRFIRGVVIQGLGEELDVEGCLAQLR